MTAQTKEPTHRIKEKQPINIYKFSIGFFVVYFIVMMAVPYYLYNHAPFSLFLTYFSNVDIVSNILTITYPDYFSHIYNINPDTIWKYISYNIISIVALSGIFIHGINEKNKKGTKPDLFIFASMIVMSIITWTLPTDAIPYLTDKVIGVLKKEQIYYKHKEFYDIAIATGVSLMFVLLEGFIIHTFITHE
jgi:hypothetical protein